MGMKTKSKLTSIIRVSTVFAITITGAEKIHGADYLVKDYFEALMVKEAELHRKEKANLESQIVQKEQHEREVEREMSKIKLEAGGSGANTPLPVRIGKLRKMADIAKILDQKLTHLEGYTLVDKVQTLEASLKDTEEAKERLAQQYGGTQFQMAVLQTELGGTGRDSPVQVRTRKLSNSLKQNASNLTEAVSTLAQELHDIPGDDLWEKINSLKRELDHKTNALVEAQEVIVEKEEAYADLYTQHLEAKNAVQDLDAELSVIQVENLKNKEQLNDVLNKQFQKQH